MGEAKRRQSAAHAAISRSSCRRITVDGVGTTRGDFVTNAAMDEGIKELAKRAFDAQGLAAFDCPIEAAAIHEAGHCVMHRLIGDELAHCRIEEKHVAGSSIWLGITSRVDESPWSTTWTPRRLLEQACLRKCSSIRIIAAEPRRARDVSGVLQQFSK